MTDSFATAATAEARRESPLYDNEVLSYGVRMAEWARDHLAAQEPTEEEVEVLARMTTEEVSGCGWETFSEESRNFHRESARRRLAVVRKARA